MLEKTSGALSDSIFRYSNTPTRSQPELMKRMEAAGVVAPPRFHCKVDDVLPQESPMIICAAARDDKPVVRVVGDLAAVNVGDVISVPLAESKVADPVLSKGTQGNKGDTYLAWTVAADGASIKVESQAACPTVEELVASVSK